MGEKQKAEERLEQIENEENLKQAAFSCEYFILNKNSSFKFC